MKKPSNLLDQNKAVGSYLADMLGEPLADSPTAAVLTDSGQLDNLFMLRQALAEVPDNQPDVNRVDQVPEDLPESPASEPVVDNVPTPGDALQFPLQCLMFSVGAQQLSMPLIQMSGVVEPPEKFSRLPGSSEVIRGVFHYRGSNVQVIDSAALLGIRRDQDVPPAKLIVLQGDKWAITVDNLASVVSIEAEGIKLSGSKRPSMMLGTIKSSLAQLLSPDAITETHTLNRYISFIFCNASMEALVRWSYMVGIII